MKDTMLLFTLLLLCCFNQVSGKQSYKSDPCQLLLAENQAGLFIELQPIGNNDSVAIPVKSTLHSYTIGYGISIIQVKELNLMPKVNKGFQNSLFFKYEKRNKMYKSLSLLGGYGSPENEIEKENGNVDENVNGMLEIKYQHNWSIIEKTGYSYFLGPYLSYNYTIAYYPKSDECHAYWGSSFMLGASNNLFRNIGRGRFWNTSLNFSLFGIVSRPDTYRLYKIEYVSFSNIISKSNSYYNFSTWVNSYKINLTTGIIWPSSGKVSFGIDYSMYYSKIDCRQSNPLIELIHTINLKIIL